MVSQSNSINTSTTDEPDSTSTEWGWNYGLTNPVIASPFANEANYFSMPGTLAAGAPHWTIAIESENGPGASAPGPACQSFPITNTTLNPNSNPGVATVQVDPYTEADGSQGLSVELKTDLYNNTQPAGAGYFTWYAFGVNVDLDGGPLPPPDLAQFNVNVLYTSWLPDAGDRMDVTYQGWWNNQSFEIDIDLNRQGDDWGANSGTLVQNVLVEPAFTDVQLNGAALGLSLIPGVATNVNINWGSVLQTLIAQDVIAAPVGGWSNSVSQAFYVSTELENQAATQSGITSLTFNSFDISSNTSPAASTTTQIGGDTMFSVVTGDNGTQVTDSLTGAVVQTLPSASTDTLQFLSIDNIVYGTNMISAVSLGLNPSQLRDYDGNALGGTGQWDMLGLASVQPGASPSYILVNPTTGRWAEVGVQPDGTINPLDNGDNGNTRIVGIYTDPLIAAGIVALGGPDDSQTRFLADVQANRLDLTGSVFDQQNGGMDLIFQLNNSNDVYLRAILFPDGNIQYANYVTTTQLVQWATSQQISPTIYNAWIAHAAHVT
jgi:hypothetical protein